MKEVIPIVLPGDWYGGLAYRFKVEGRTRSGRRLVAFINPDSREEGVWFCITAMEEER